MKNLLIFSAALLTFGLSAAQIQSNTVTPTGAPNPPATNTTTNISTTPVRTQQPSQGSEMRPQTPPPPGTIQQNPHGNAMSPATGVNTLENNNGVPANTAQGTNAYRNTDPAMPATNTSNQGGYNAAPAGSGNRPNRK